MKKFSKFEIAAIKRTAASVNKYVERKKKLLAQQDSINAELESISTMLNTWEEPIKQMTGGYTTEDLVTKHVITTDKSQAIKFELKYPETVVPSESQETCGTYGFCKKYDSQETCESQETHEVTDTEVSEDEQIPTDVEWVNDPQYHATHKEFVDGSVVNND